MTDITKNGKEVDTTLGSGEEDIISHPLQPQYHSAVRSVASEEKHRPLEEDSLSEEIEHDVTVISREKRASLKRQPSCDSLFTRKHPKPAGVWRPYGPPLYGCVTVTEESPFEEEKSASEEIEHCVSVDSSEKRVPLKRQSSCDSLFTGKHLKPGGVWRPYGPPLYGHGSALNLPRRKGPDTLVILAAIFYCLAALTAVVFAVLFKTSVVTCQQPCYSFT
uniref:Uncharacterized protein n=1 Tax=Branchiostoma floridae TaxID=7739 RepID=C3YU96_BRAFL|eukprot:XP_002600361.1 hypothetical protein BRAFLDRAFT_66594 [Branchiostoma floridae]